MAVYRPPGVYAFEEIRSIAPSPIPNADVIAIVSEVPSAAPHAERIVLSGISQVQLEKEGVVGNSIEVYSRDEFTHYIAGTDYTIISSGTNDYNSFKSIVRANNRAVDEIATFSTAARSYQLINGRGVHDIVVETSDGIATTTYQPYVDYTYDPYANKLIVLPNGSIPTDGSQVLITYSYGIEDEEEVLVRYNYANAEYYGHHLLNDESEIYARFGFPFKDDGSPNPMSLAAWLAFTNGGPQTQVLAVPVNPHAIIPDRTQPTQVEWQEAFDSIVEDSVSLVVETSGTLAYHGLAYSHVLGASQYNQERIAILGRDGFNDPGLKELTNNAAQKQALRDQSRAFNFKRSVLVSPSKWETVDTVNGSITNLGGQYAAAALAGRLTVYNRQDTMTRKAIVNIRSRAIESQPTMNEDAFAGLCVIENKGGFMRVRHSITTAFSNINHRELNVIRAQDFVIQSLRDSLDRTVIGMLMEPDVDFMVQGAATNILDRMKNSYVIADYQAPQVFQDINDPTRLRLRFEYLPNYPVNEISIEFSISPLGTSVITT